MLIRFLLLAVTRWALTGCSDYKESVTFMVFSWEQIPTDQRPDWSFQRRPGPWWTYGRFSTTLPRVSKWMLQAWIGNCSHRTPCNVQDFNHSKETDKLRKKHLNKDHPKHHNWQYKKTSTYDWLTFTARGLHLLNTSVLSRHWTAWRVRYWGAQRLQNMKLMVSALQMACTGVNQQISLIHSLMWTYKEVC